MRNAPQLEVMQSHELIKVKGGQRVRHAGVFDDPAIFPIQTGNDLDKVERGKLRRLVKPDNPGPTDELGGACYLVVPKNSQSADSPRFDGNAVFRHGSTRRDNPGSRNDLYTTVFHSVVGAFATLRATADDPTRPQQQIVKRFFTVR
jgi:hypothetical protein